MKIEYFSELDVRFLTNSNNGRRWMLISPFNFAVDDEPFSTPAGFYTDFASIPKIIWPIISPYDLGKGPIPHDLGFFSGLKSFGFWNRVLIACMEYEKIKHWKHSPVYKSVSSCLGEKVWDNYRKQGNTFEQLLKVKGRKL